MNRSQVWKRLLWKEVREGWLPVTVGLLAPTVLFPLAFIYASWSWQRGMLLTVVVFGVHLLVILWAATKADRNRHGGDFQLGHLPVKPTVEWAASFAVPAVVVAAVRRSWKAYMQR